MRRICVVILQIVICCYSLGAQQLSESYYAENPQQDLDNISSNDTLLFYTPFVHQPVFERIARYALSYVRYNRRGSERSEAVWLGRVPITSPMMRYGDYVTLAALRQIPSQRSYTYSTSEPIATVEERGEHFTPSINVLDRGERLRLQYAERNYRLGAHYNHVGKLTAEGWSYSLATGGRGGRDANVDGAFNNQAYWWSACEYTSGADDWGFVNRFMAAVLVPVGVRAPRSWNSAEVYSLANNTLYNSYWGYQSGSVRSSRLKVDCLPALYGAWRLTDRYDLTDHLAVEMIARAGVRTSTSLEWSDAHNPTPDHYSQLPSHYADPALAQQIRDVWHKGNSDYTQINWPLLYEINSLSERGAVYALMGDRERVQELKINLSTGAGRDLWSRNELPNPDGISKGRLNLFGAWYKSRFDSVPYDLLGGEKLAEGYNLYDYSVVHRAVGGDYAYGIGGDFGNVGLGARAEWVAMAYDNHSDGYGLMADNMLNMRLKATWNYLLGWNNSLGASAMYSLTTPYFRDLIVAPEGYAGLNPYATGQKAIDGEVWGRWSFGRVATSLNLYANYSSGASSVSNFWNDLEGVYATFVAGGIDMFGYGMEGALQVPLMGGFELEAIVALSTNRYCSEAVADIVDHDSGRVIADGIGCNIKGLRTTSSPEAAVVLRVSGELWDGWRITAEGAVAAGRYIAPSLYFCSSYISTLNLSPEAREEFLFQEQLGTAPNLNFLLARRFNKWSLSLSLRNLVGGGRTIYGGYRPMRIKARRSDNIVDYRPHPSRYQYTYPSSVYLTVGYDF